MSLKPVSYKLFNPNAFHLRDAMDNANIRFIFLYGGSSSSKSYSVAQMIVLETLRSGTNTLTLRKVGAAIKNSIYEDFKQIISNLGLADFFSPQLNTIKCFNGAKIDFSGLDDPEKIKGISNYQRVVIEEISEFDEGDFKQIRKRLRGRKGQQIIAMFNPISEDHWIKKKIFDVEELTEIPPSLFGKLKDSKTGKILPKEYSEIAGKWINKERIIHNPKKGSYEKHAPDMVIMKSTYLNNFWVVGSPDGTYGYYDRQTIADFDKDKERDYDYYNIYALGEWGSIRTGGEFLHAFNPAKHKSASGIDLSMPVHLSVDNNVLPYISISFWQIIGFSSNDVRKVRQVHEIAAEDPFNTVTQAAKLAVKYLTDSGFKEKVFLYGDQTTTARNTIDDDKRSFFDKFKEVLENSFVVEERMPSVNPSVPMTGEFVNSILSDEIKSINISINNNCSKSINDYICSKKDVNGGILKKRKVDKLTGQSYEEHGHFTDTMRYFLAEAFKEEYTKFSLRRKHNKHKEEDMKYYDTEKMDLTGAETFVQIHPDVNGKFVMICGRLKNGKVYIANASLIDGMMDNEMLTYILEPMSPDSISFEAQESYFPFIRDLRENFDNIRAGRDYPQKEIRISAQSDFIKNNFLFRADYDLDAEYTAFIENAMDYKEGKTNIEALNCLSSLSEMLKRNRSDEFKEQESN